MSTLVPVILAGGEGKRLSPLSTQERPKQFLKLLSNSPDTLFQSAARRALMLTGAENVITITTENYSKISRQQLTSVNDNLNKNVILEPCGRNTAAAIAAAAIHACENFFEPILWIIPSDHIISNELALKEAVKKSLREARYGKIALFGINPTRADSNYGYIIGGDSLNNEDERPAFAVSSFIEKPIGAALDSAMAEKNRWWNSGMFVLSAATFFDEMKKYDTPTLRAVSASYQNAKYSKHGISLDRDIYSGINPSPIDKTIIEKSTKTIVIPVEMDWTDIGSWHALKEFSKHESKGNLLESILSKLSRAA